MPRGGAVGGTQFHTLSTLAALSAAFFSRPPASRASGTPRALRAVARCLIIRTAVHQFACIIRAVVTILPGVSLAVPAWGLSACSSTIGAAAIIRCSRAASSASVHVAEAFGYRIRRKMQIQGLRRAAVTTV